MKRLFLLLLLFTIAGCATAPERDPIIVTKTVEVPVTVKCSISYPKEPSRTVLSVLKGATPYEKVQGVLQELEDQRQYAKELLVVLSECTTDTN